MSVFRFPGQQDWARHIRVDHPGRFAPSLIRFARSFGKPVADALYRPRLEGLEHLPDGPFLLVANHSAGIAVAELGSFFTLWLNEFADRKPLAGFTLPLSFRTYPLNRLLRAGGAIPSTYAAAAETLAAGVPVLVFPGGDYEALRPVWQANRVDFGGRTGFLRVAADAGVPIVPMGIRGSHYTAPILWRSEALANALVVPRLLGLKRWPVTVLGLAGAGLILFGPGRRSLTARLGGTAVWLASPLMLLPWIPASIRFRIGEPMDIRELLPEGAEDPQARAGALARVEGAVQALVSGT